MLFFCCFSFPKQYWLHSQYIGLIISIYTEQVLHSRAIAVDRVAGRLKVVNNTAAVYCQHKHICRPLKEIKWIKQRAWKKPLIVLSIAYCFSILARVSFSWLLRAKRFVLFPIGFSNCLKATGLFLLLFLLRVWIGKPSQCDHIHYENQ